MSKHAWPDDAEDSGASEETVVDEAQETAEKADEPTESTDESTEKATEESAEQAEPAVARRRVDWSRVVAFGVLPGLALLLAMAAGYLKWQDNSVRNADVARMESMQVAKDSTIAMFSYKPDTVEQQLTDARDLLSGEFRDRYISMTNVVIPGAKEKQVSAVVSVPAVASVSAEPNHAVVLLFVNQTVVVGQGTPTDTPSRVRVTLDKVGDRWLISKFDPV